MKVNKHSILASVLLVLLLCPAATAAPTTRGQAEDVVRGWLAYNDSAPFEHPAGTLSRVEAYGENGKVPDSDALYYAAFLEPKGIILLPAEDILEPITAYLPDATKYGPEPPNPIFDVLGSNIAATVKRSRTAAARSSGVTGAQGKWEAFQEMANPTGRGAHLPAGQSPQDVRVDSFLGVHWDQEFEVVKNDGEERFYVYNASTPYNYPAGCGAVMMAQIMAHIQYPTDDVLVGSKSFRVKVNGQDQMWDSYGSPYNLRNIFSENLGTVTDGITSAQAQIIGRLLADAAISIGSEFSDGATLSYPERVADALTDTFRYKSAMLANVRDLDWHSLNMAINANLDAGIPVGLGIGNSSGGAGHAVVADGYGYDSGTLYHHLNWGWAQSDAGAFADTMWYTLSSPALGFINYDLVNTVIYNVFGADRWNDPSIVGREIISGRVVTSYDVPVPNAFVKLTGGGLEGFATTGGNGIFAFTQLPSRTEFTITAEYPGLSLPTIKARTGESISPNAGNGYTSSVGNVMNDMLVQEGADSIPGGCGVGVYTAAFLLAGAAMVSASKLRALMKRR